MLTRIYGTAFFSKKDLEAHLERIEEAKARDHRRLGPQLGLFMLRKEAPGMPFWLSHGTTLLRLIEAEVQKQLRKRDYEEIKTPHVMDVDLWHRSGHWDNYRENMYFTESGEREYAIRPMNCPGACLVFDAERHSYRELPLRIAEFGQGFRAQRGGGYRRGNRRALRPLRLRGRADRALDPAAEVDRQRRAVGAGRAGPAHRPGEPGPRVHAHPRRRRLLGAEDRLPHPRRAGPLLAVRDLPGQLLHAGALRPHLHRPERRAAPPGDDPPRPARLDGALRRDPDRAPRRPFPGLAGTGAGGGAADLRPPRRPRRGGDGEAARPRRQGGARPPLGVDRQEGPRRRTGPQSLHARRRRPRAGERRSCRSLPCRG